MNKQLFILFFLLFTIISSQNTVAQEPKNNTERVYTKEEVDTPISFNGGMQKIIHQMVSRMSNNVPYGSQFKIIMQFVVEPNGEVTTIEIIDTACIGLQTEVIEKQSQAALNIIKGIIGWVPATKNGKNIRSIFTLPITLQSQ